MRLPEVDSQVALTLAAAMELLAETRDYLLRLPPVAVTLAEAERIDQFLRAPESALARRAASTERALSEQRSGWVWGDDGVPALVAVATATKLELSGEAIGILATQTTTWRDGRQVPIMTLELQPVAQPKPVAGLPARATAKRQPRRGA